MGIVDSCPATAAASDVMSGQMPESRHVRLTPLRTGTAADSARARQLVAEMRRALTKYQDVHVAESDGFRMTLRGVQLPVYHFTSWRRAIEAMGRFDEALLPASPRTRKLLENEKWTAYDVVLDVWPEVFAWGVLVVPKDIKPGERRPVVVCQHGRNGLPRMLVDGKETAYNQSVASESVYSRVPLATSQTLTARSAAAEASSRPSGLKAKP